MHDQERWLTDPFARLLRDIWDLHERKAHDYADGGLGNLRAARELGISPYLGVLLRLNDKMTRLKCLAHRAQQARVRDESVRDTLLDVACYALLAVLLLEDDGAS